MVPDNFLERLALLSGVLPPGIFERLSEKNSRENARYHATAR